MHLHSGMEKNMKNIPEIRKFNEIDTLFVNNEPFVVLAGELHNSSASSLNYMEDHVWPNLEGLNMNSVLLPIYWELIEPEEGVFDFALLDGIIMQARKYKKHLVLLWFGLWKNSESMYAPSWMKKDTKKYFRARKVNGEVTTTISPLCLEAVEKDALALYEIMSHLKSMDEDENSVIIIQVENEIGLLGTDRDYCETAEAAFHQELPNEVSHNFNVNGNWSEAFGEEAGEYFMAYHFACAIESITKKAKSAYNLPCYTNAWLRQYPWFAGSYPSGGPVVNMHKIWKIAAPSLFCLAPDIYVSYVAQVLDEYAYEGNPLFIPEVRKDAVTASYALYAFAKHNAIGYSPFGIEELALSENEIDKPPMEVMHALNIDPTAFDTDGSFGYLSDVYRFFNDAKSIYFQYRGTDQMQAFIKKSETDIGTLLKFTAYNIQVAYAPKHSHQPLAAGMIIELSENSFYIIGMMSMINVIPKPGKNVKVEVLKLEEGHFNESKWTAGRVLNGDEKMAIRLSDKLCCYYLELLSIS